VGLSASSALLRIGGILLCVKDLFKGELIRAMQTAYIREPTTQPARTSESTDGLPAPPPLTIQIFNAATPLPEGTGNGTQLARIEEGTNLMITHMRSGVRALAWYNLTIAALALFVTSRYLLSGILWLAFIVTLIVTRKGAKKASFMERVFGSALRIGVGSSPR
jgi:hypothetical protein